jgi:hypothetical protein
VKALRQYLSEHAKTDLADAHVLGALPGLYSIRCMSPAPITTPCNA